MRLHFVKSLVCRFVRVNITNYRGSERLRYTALIIDAVRQCILRNLTSFDLIR